MQDSSVANNGGPFIYFRVYNCYIIYRHSVSVQKEYKRALDIWLSIADPCVFDHINHHPELYDAAGRGAAQLMVVDADRAIDMLVEHHDKVHANDVIKQLRARLDTAPPEEVPQWRQRLCRYLHALFLKDRRAPHNFHDLQVRSSSGPCHRHTCMCSLHAGEKKESRALRSGKTLLLTFVF